MDELCVCACSGGANDRADGGFVGIEEVGFVRNGMEFEKSEAFFKLFDEVRIRWWAGHQDTYGLH